MEDTSCDAFMLDLMRNLSMEDYNSNENEKKRIIEQFKRYKPICSSCKLRDGCKFRYMNNPQYAKTLQPRYQCHNCKKHFTFGGRKHYNTPSSKKSKHEEEAKGIALTNCRSAMGSFVDLPSATQKSSPASSGQAREHEGNAIVHIYEDESGLIQVWFNHPPGSFVHLPSATQKSNPASPGQAREHEGNVILDIYEHESGLIQVRWSNHPPTNLEIKEEEWESWLNMENKTGFNEEEFGFMQL